MVLPPAREVVDRDQNAAQQPARRIAHAHEQGRVNVLGADEQVQLAEDHKRQQHDDHGGGGIPGAAHGPGQHLVKAAQHITRGQPEDEHRAVGEHIPLAAEHHQQRAGQAQQQAGQHRRAADGQQQGNTGALFGAL